MSKVLVLNGPNLQLLGVREVQIYGRVTLDSIIGGMEKAARENGVEITSFQSNCEGALCDRIAAAMTDGTDGIIINAGAYTHYSIALRDALAGAGLPFIEVHLSNVYRREEFRHKSVLASAALGVIAGFGPASYMLALTAMTDYLKSSSIKGTEK